MDGEKFLLWNSEESSILITTGKGLSSQGKGLSSLKDKIIFTHKGKIEIENLEYGDTIFSTQSKKYFVLKPTNEDINSKITRKTNTFVIKDLSMILSYTSVNKFSKVLEIGVGSGACNIFLSNFVNKVVSIDIDINNLRISKENIIKYGNSRDSFLILSNEKLISFKNESFDCIVIDIPEPEIYVDLCYDVLKFGGDLVFAVPNIEQVKRAREVFSKHKFVYFRTIEVWVRKWLVRPNYSRPHHEMQAHSMFFTFCKKIK